MTTDSSPGAVEREFTLRGIVLGAVITVLFTAANIYLGLKVGLTFASSIPAAVISMAVLRFVRGSNILENNIVQTLASAAGTLSSIIFILPGLILVGYWSGFPYWQTACICGVGGVLGVMFTVPLRRAMVVESDLPYPEGVAAAEILKVGSHSAEQENSAGTADHPGMRDVVLGGGMAGAFAIVSSGFGLFATEVTGWLRFGGIATGLGASLSLALVGAGYLVGIVVGLAMLVGVLIAWGVAVPILTTLHPAPAGMDAVAYANTVWRHDVRLIGAGAIGVAAIWTLIQLAKPLIHGIRSSLAALAAIRSGRGQSIPRTDRDLPLDYVAGVSLLLMLPLAFLFYNFVGASGVFDPEQTLLLSVAATLFSFVVGFIVAAASGYMAGLIGSSNSPISGIGIIAIVSGSVLLTVALGGHGGLLASLAVQKEGIALAIFATSAVLAAATVSNDNLQDLKTGQLVGASPWRQQVALIMGVIVGSMVIPPILELVYQAYGFAGSLPHDGMDPARALAAPQATLMSTLAKGILSGDIDWTMITTGAALGVVVIAADEALKWRGGKVRLPPLAVGLGIYLPSAVTTPVTLGAVMVWLIDRQLRRQAVKSGSPVAAFVERRHRRGVLIASGLIVGESLFGVILAAIIVASGSQSPLTLVGSGFETIASALGGIVFLFACFEIYRRVVADKSAPQ